ncbi:MAG: hypothetical protein ACLTSZ_03085 [Lachnospiraceae bacterium]
MTKAEFERLLDCATESAPKTASIRRVRRQMSFIPGSIMKV